ncbi:hypothetical protein VNO77_21240 [Canavalia gladiata]|uniref:Uncharacterized protein n=1 Tax=Canavalia gladiata TaxID=3824 RepID=A0AAN9QLX3_CANGL
MMITFLINMGENDIQNGIYFAFYKEAESVAILQGLLNYYGREPDAEHEQLCQFSPLNTTVTHCENDLGLGLGYGSASAPYYY